MRRAAAGLAVALALSACSYDFRNPAEKLGTGQALGRVVVDPGGGAQPLDGALVTLENSASFNQVTRSTGRFTLLSLPIGQHRVLFRKGTQWAAERVVEIVPGDDGKPEGVNLGDVRLRYPVTIQGSFSLPGGFDAFSLTSLVFDVTDEVSGQPAALASSPSGPNLFQYSLRGLATGAHRIRFVVAGLDFFGTPITYTAAPLTFTVPEASEGQQLTMNPLSLDPEPVGTPGAIRFRIQGVGPNGGAAARGSAVELHDALLDPTGFGTYVVDSLTPDSSGFVQADELPGLYVARVVPPPHGGPDSTFWIEPDPVRLLVRSGRLNDLGTVYLVDSFTGSNAAFACFSSADCTGGTCVDFQCQGGTFQAPPTVAPSRTPFCLADTAPCLSTMGGSCNGGFGQCQRDCSNGRTALTICAPLPTFDPTFSFSATPIGLPCTLDGVTVLTGDTQVGACPFQ